MAMTEKKIALVLSNHFDAREYVSLHNCLLNKGFLTSVVGEKSDEKLLDLDKKTEVVTEVSFDEARSYGFDAIIVSDGYSTDNIRANESAQTFIKGMYENGNIVGAIHHGAHVLISAGILKGKNVTGWHSIKVDLENAGARYFDEPVVIDGSIVTGRGPEDVGVFCDAIVNELSRQAESAA